MLHPALYDCSVVEHIDATNTNDISCDINKE